MNKNFKFLALFLSLLAGIGLLVTVPVSAKEGNNVPKINNGVQKLGGDRDAHGCIGSAGYVWSETAKKCIRPWEQKDKIKATTTPEKDKKTINADLKAAQTQYLNEIKAAEKSYKDAVATANKNYRDALKTAKANYQTALASSTDAAAKKTARNNYNTAVKQATKDMQTAKKTALEAFKAAKKTALDKYKLARRAAQGK